MTPAPKPRRISREEAIRLLTKPVANHDWFAFWFVCYDEAAAIRMAIRALKREQKAAAKKQKEPKR